MTKPEELIKLEKMKINDITRISTETEVLRVPNGWMYITRKTGMRGDVAVTSTFVPERI